jgi:leader peptidase (prepilin peptidase)/N-methyltransferase
MPPVLLYVTAAIFGAIIGSFLNVVVLRDNRRSTIMTGRSECMHCGHVLQWYELIPLVSFLVQGGKCRACKKKLSWQYPLGEILTAGLAVFSVWYGFVERGSLVLAVGTFLALASFFVLSATDFRTMEVRPDYAITAAIFGGGAQILSGNLTWTSVVYGLLLGGGVIFILAYGWKLLTGRLGMGEGDIWIAAAVGALVGYPGIIPALFLAVGIGAVAGILFALKSRKGLAIEMPFGPYLAIGGLLALVWGQLLLNWYIL